MDALKKQRAARRTAFTKAYTSFTSKMDSDALREEKLVAFHLLESKMSELDTTHSVYNEALFKSNLTEEEIEKELETDDVYKTNYLTAKLRISDEFTPAQREATPRIAPQTDSKKCMKMPKIEMPKFDGSVREWLPFWSQYRKVHEDPDISKEDKFVYLLQATVPESRANSIVKSFPPTAANYDKAIAALKTRFGKDDLVVEFYVRELLGLVLQNAIAGGKKPSLSHLYDKVWSYLRALESLGVTSDKCAAMLYPLVESSLPEETLRAWQRSGQRETAGNGQQDAATDNNGHRDAKDRLTRLLTFLQGEVENEERIDMALTGFNVPAESEVTKKAKGKNVDSPKNVPSASVLLVAKTDSKSKCIFCNADHESFNCETARKMTLEERKSTVQNKNCCFNCLKPGHISKRCRVKMRCEWCASRHVLLMCPRIGSRDGKAERAAKPESSERATSGAVPPEGERRSTANEHSLATFSEYPAVYLQTLRVKLFSVNKEKTVRAIIDTASQRSYICTNTAREMGYVSEGKQEVTHSLFGGVKSKSEKHELFLIRLKNLNNSYACNFTVMGQNLICDSVASFPRDEGVAELRAENITLTDVGESSGPIEVLIGADVAGKLLTGNKFVLKNGLTAFETLLGWTVMGKLPTRSEKTDTATLLTSMFVREASLTDLWSLDVIGITDPIEKLSKSVRDEKTREFLMQTATVDENGRYEVRLPWVENHAPLPSNYDIAEKRLKNCIKKLGKQQIFDAYDEVFSEWLEEGIIETVPTSEADKLGHYLPHRPVIKKHGTTKIRPVFDASACQLGYPSLNDCLEKGPNLIELVIVLLILLREGEIGVVADIRRAFLQILVSKDDRDFLRFLWVRNGRIVIYRHCRVVFGLNCSPFLLAAVIELLMKVAEQKAARDINASWSQDTAKKLGKSFYVDNCVTSVDSPAELRTFISESQSIMAAGGFDLRGWESSGDTHDNVTTLVLGVSWNKQRDTLSVNPAFLTNDVPEIVTKRGILSIVHRIFDPFGIMCPAVLKPKLLLQTLWEEKISWDAEIRDRKRDEFLNWLNELPLLKEICIPRKLGTGDLSLHVFGDASGLAYAAVVFARVEFNGEVIVKLLVAKTRVAPKKTTIPRLELMAATIAVRLANSIAQAFTRNISRIVYWTDSTTVLAWINRDTQWGTFVYNRVKEIRSLSRSEDWRYVPGDMNPADLPSRGCSPSQLVKSQWWLGPKWLYGSEEDWPVSVQSTDEVAVRSECKKTVLVRMVNLESRNFSVSEYFSSYTKLVRFLAWIKRFLKHRRAILDSRRQEKSEKATGACSSIAGALRGEKNLGLSFDEIRNAETQLLKHLQAKMFDGPSREKLTTFKTFVNEDGLRVLKTKIFNRKDDSAFLCPILLDSDSEIVQLLVKETHERLGHVGALTVVTTLRERFWIISLRKIIRSIISKCVVCRKQLAKHMECESPPLPIERVRDAAVFETTGIDFAGPLFIKGGGKAWICLFTCAVYRAIHLELATSLSVEGFIECLSRFIARRGRPRKIYSDNGTNFAGTRNALSKLDWERISKFSCTYRIEWVFIPPSSPWWGGWWERLIGVVKTILRKVLGKACLSYESLTTILCDTEAIVNSRPLTYISEDADDLMALSPSNFLHEIREVGVVDCDMLYHTKLNQKLKHRQKIIDDLRKRFRAEYLSQLVCRPGKSEAREIKVGDVVLIGDDIHKRIDWPLALVIEAIPGRDNENRVFILKTKNGLIKRSIQRLYPLELSHKATDFCKDLQEKAKMQESVREGSLGKIAAENCGDVVANADHFVKNSEDGGIEKAVPPPTTRSGRVVRKPERYQ